MSPADAARAAVRSGLDAYHWWQRCGRNFFLILRRIVYVLVALGTIWTAASGSLSGVVKAAETATMTAIDRYMEDRITKHLGPVVKKIESLHDEIVTLRGDYDKIIGRTDLSADLAIQLQRIEYKLDGLAVPRKR